MGLSWQTLFLFFSLPSTTAVAIVEQVVNSGLFDSDNIFQSIIDLFFGPRRLICAIRLLFIVLTAQDRLFFSDKYADTSTMTLSEAGDYVGADAIVEYIGFANARTTPFMDIGPIVTDGLYRVIGFDENTDQCEFHAYNVVAYELNPELTEQNPPPRALVATLQSIFIDSSSSLISRVNIFYSKPFLRWYFGVHFNTASIRDYICTDVLQNVCNDGPPVEECLADLEELPVVTGEEYVDGNSFGCRILHAAFAVTNPTGHCAHVTLDPADVDVKGNLRCAESAGTTPLDLFTAETLEDFSEWGEVSICS